MANVWEQRKLGEIITEYKETVDSDCTLPILTSSKTEGVILQEEHFGRKQQHDITGYNILPRNYCTYRNRSDGVDFTFNINKCCDKGIISKFYPVFSGKNSDVFFLSLVLNNSDEVVREIAYTCTGTGQKVLSFLDLQKMKVRVPNFDEQKEIATYFDYLDHLITLHQRKAICTKNVRNNHILSIFLWERAVFMGKMILYHGSPNEMIHPIYGWGEDKHDYGRGFYLTANIELAKEWAVCRPDQSNGWVHKYELVTDDLGILDFQQLNVLSWLAELMKHREASDSKRYRVLAVKFIDKYGIDTDGYDVIKGWRADASYFYIAKAFVRDEIDVDILEELLFLGDLGIQYCIKSEKGYANLHELESELLPVSFADFNDKYNERDIAARENMRKLIDSDANKVTKVFSTLI